MSEWPKWVHVEDLEEKPPSEPDVADEVRVIPVALGRELYEALKRFVDQFNPQAPPVDNPLYAFASEALSHYEREVDSP